MFVRFCFLKKIFFVLFLISLSAIVFALPDNMIISITPYTGIEFGVFEEAYFFENDSKYADDICSMLEWEQKPAVVAGIEGKVCFKNFGFFADISTKLPFKCGVMKDSDYWENGVHFNYSENDNYVDKAFSAVAGFCYLIELPFFSVEPSIQASYSYISFNARDGHGWYAGPSYSSDGKLHSWDSEYAHYYPDGKYHLAGVDYLNQTFYFMTGVRLSKIFFSRWDVSLGVYFAPFTYSYAKDHHLGKNNNFYTEDFIYNYFRNFKITVGNDFIVNDHFTVVSVVEGNLQLFTKGEDYENGYPNNQMGGESYKGIKIKLGTKFTL